MDKEKNTTLCVGCETTLSDERIHLGFTDCVECSKVDKYSSHTIYPHKTGGYIQVVSKEQSNNLNRLDRRGTGMKSAPKYKEFNIDTITEPKPFKNRKCTKTYTTYSTALKQVIDYYNEWGYEPTLKELRRLNSSGDIPLMTRVKIQDIITDMYLEPSPRALQRHFNK